MKSIVIGSAVRTAIGKIGGTLKDVPAEKLASHVIMEALRRVGADSAEVDEVIFGQAKQSTDAPNIARVAMLMAGMPEEIPAYSVHRQCGSGLQSIINAYMQINGGYDDFIIAGGTESMSTAPYYIRNGRYGYGSGNGELLDPNTESQPRSQPEDKYGRFTMGMTAENVADKHGITRVQQDAFAFSSQQKAVAAIEAGKFKDEIVGFDVIGRKETICFDTDEYPRKNISLEKMASLKPIFKKDGSVTAGNSSGRNDGASALTVMTEEKAVSLGIAPMARIVAFAAAGCDPKLMGLGPVPATRKALERAGLTLNDIDLIELNEAFAAQSLGVIKELEIDPDIVNVNGGAIALGHPLGCTGARITTTLLYEMIKRNSRYGLATLCIAGGLGVSVIYENLQRR